MFVTEPLPSDSPLWDMPNVTITPHAAGETVLSRRRADEMFTDNLGRYVRGERCATRSAEARLRSTVATRFDASVGSRTTSPNRAAFRVLGGPAMGEPVAPVVVCWSVKGGSGTTVVAASLAVLSARHHPTLLVDLAGDSAIALGAREPAGPGISEWLHSPNAGADALARLAVQVGERLGADPPR